MLFGSVSVSSMVYKIPKFSIIFCNYVFGLGQAGGQYVDRENTISSWGGNFMPKTECPQPLGCP